MIMTKGNALPTSENALYLRPAWENGYVGKFTPDCSCFCRGCNYTVLVSAEKEGYITLGAKVSGEIIDLTTFQASQGAVAEVYDSVLYWHTQCYSYQLNQVDKDLRVRLDSFAGDPNIYVNPGVVPNNLMSFAFNSRDHFENEELILTPSERAKISTSTLYYICIFGNTAATYKLTVNNNDFEVFLKSGLSESGYVDYNETQVFYYRDPILAQESVNISFQLHVMTGQARLRAKLCPVNFNDKLPDLKSACTMTTEEMLAIDPDEKIEAHLGSEMLPTDTDMCMLPQSNGGRDQEVSCVVVVGVLGIATYQTHFSTLLKVQQEAHHTILKEGVPQSDEMIELAPSYYMASIHNPNVTKITFQLTTIHGDPDLFISQSVKLPTPYQFETRSIRCGIYPEQVQYLRKPNQTLEGDYYIAVYGYVQSTYSLVYYVETMDDDRHVPMVKLVMGQKQKGVLKSVNESMVYQFKLSNEVHEKVQVRLHSENGQYNFFVGQIYIPNSTHHLTYGDQQRPAEFKQRQIDVQEAEVYPYYIKVIPAKFNFEKANNTQDTADMALQFTIAFYEQGSFIHLVEGIPTAGVVANSTFDYYYIDFKSSSDTEYEFSLTSKSGNPDLVLSVQQYNKFPDKMIHDFISEDQFSSDTIIINTTQIQQSKNIAGDKSQINRFYVGVYTNDMQKCSYSILVTQRHVFTPILMSNGQLQAGSVEVNETKYYYFKTGSTGPLYASLVSKTGNPNLAIYIIKNLSMSMYEWPSYVNLTSPTFSSKESMEADLIYLDPNDNRFKNGCGSSCILLITVDGNSSNNTSHYSLQVTRDMIELSDSVRFEDTVLESTNYKYYKFYKSCGQSCDLEITVDPLQTYQNMLLVIDADNGTGILPTKINQPMWISNVFTNTIIDIQSDDIKLKTLSTNGSQNLYLIGVYSLSNASYFITARTFPHVTAAQLKKGDHIGLKKLFIGESPSISFLPNQVHYFFFENWSNSTIKFQVVTPTFSDAAFQIQISSIAGKQLPKEVNVLKNLTWISNKRGSKSLSLQKQYPDTLKINYMSEQFCVQCYFIVMVQSMQKNEEADINIIASQDDESGKGYTSHIVIGRPTPVKLQAFESAIFSFKYNPSMKNTSLYVHLQYFTGKANLNLLDTTYYYGVAFLSDPTTQDEITYSLSSIQNSNFDVCTISSGLVSQQFYQIQVQALSDLHATLLLSMNTSLQVIPDSLPHRVQSNNNNLIESRYFTYLPPSSKFQLAVEVKAYTFGQSYQLSVKKVSSDNLFNSSSNRDLQQTRYGQRTAIHPNVQSQFQDVKFDYQLHSSSQEVISKNGVHTSFGGIFEVIPIQMQDEEDTLLIKLELNKTVPHADIELTLSGSEIQFLQPGQTVRGHVSNFNQTYKIFEVYINNDAVAKSNATDLYIEVTPCNGRVNFYVSDDYMALFTDAKKAGFIDLITQQKFGSLSSTVKNISQYETVYIGVMSSNELFTGFSQQLDSQFQVKTSLVGGNGFNSVNSYILDKTSKSIEVMFGSQKDPDEVVLRWTQIYHKDQSATGSYQAIPPESITYRIFAGTRPKNILTLNSICAIDQNPEGVFAIFVPQSDEQDREIVLRREDLKDVQVITIIAQVKDPLTHQIVELAYDPYILMPQEVFGVQIQTYQLVLLILLGVLSLFCLGVVVYCLRRKSVHLLKRLENEIVYQQQDFSSSDFNHSSSDSGRFDSSKD